MRRLEELQKLITQTANNTLQRITFFCYGVLSLFLGLVCCFSSMQFWAVINRDTYQLLKIVVLVMVAIPITVSPFWLIHYLTSFLINLEPIGYWELVSKLKSELFYILPTIISFLSRRVFSSVSDSIFFSVLSSQNEELAKAVEIVVPWKKVFNQLFWKLLKLLALMLLCLGAMGFQYLFGAILHDYIEYTRMSLQIYFCYRTLGIEGGIMSLLLNALISRDSVGHFLAICTGAIVLSKELLDPYRCRVSVGKGEKGGWKERDMRWQYMLLGFGLCSSLLLGVPLFGWVLWTVVQGAASSLLIEALDKIK